MSYDQIDEADRDILQRERWANQRNEADPNEETEIDWDKFDDFPHTENFQEE